MRRSRKATFKYNKKGKLTGKEEKEIQRTSMNIFDWFSGSRRLETEQAVKKVDTEEQDTTRSNGLSNVLLVVTGQSNRSSSNVSEMECSWGQDEHLLLKGAPEEEDETGGGSGGMLLQAEGHQGIPQMR